MKKKYIIFTRHAEERLKQRNISAEQVKRTIYEPHFTLPAWGKKKRAMRDFGNRYLDVIYREKETAIVIVTAAWLKEKERFNDVKD